MGNDQPRIVAVRSLQLIAASVEYSLTALFSLLQLPKELPSIKHKDIYGYAIRI